ncbi:MAG TPA: 50S ribosomal protein L10 [Solirubrobacterales bacterium]|nr:50S ribosomal protein L10 [Solirubrobacterales bacterium]
MNRDEKAAAVAELSDRLKEADAVFAIDYRGISVSGSAELRRKLAEADAVFKVVKNRLAKRAAADAGTEGIDELLTGPTALALIKGDAVVAAKAITTFARDNDVLAFKGGLMDGQPLDTDGFTAIARLPGRDVLHGQLVGIAASPLTGLARGLGSMLSGLAVALGQIQEQGLVGGDAPAEEASAEEAPAAEAPVAQAPADEAAADEAASEDAASEQAQGEASEQAPAAEEPAEGDETSNDEDEADGAAEAPAGEAEGSDDAGSPEEAEAGEAAGDPESEEESG